jgi:hypothetical protein
VKLGEFVAALILPQREEVRDMVRLACKRADELVKVAREAANGKARAEPDTAKKEGK